jgi:hypothetical protein
VTGANIFELFQVDAGPVLFSGPKFAVENRASLGELQNPAAVAALLRQPGPFHAKIANFHLLFFLVRDTHFDLQVCVHCNARMPANQPNWLLCAAGTAAAAAGYPSP